MVLSGGQSITRIIRLRLLGAVASSARLAVLSNIEEATPFALACVYDVWKGDGGKAITSFAIVTTNAAPSVAQHHDRMPVVLDDSHFYDGCAARPIRQQAY
jgi:hypothetical protein